MYRSDALIRALWLADNHLIDNHIDNKIDEKKLQTGIERRIENLYPLDERIASNAIKRVLKEIKDPMDNIHQLNDVMFELHQGMPILCNNLKFQHLNRLIDPDTLCCLHEKFSFTEKDEYNWAAIPIRDGHQTNSVLDQGSIDTHIHLGGTLPPLYFWVQLMTAQIKLNTFESFNQQRRGYAKKDDWYNAITQAICIRLELAKTVQKYTNNQAFPHLSNTRESVWELFNLRKTKNKSFAEIRDNIFHLTFTKSTTFTEQRFAEIEKKSWTFLDPLRFSASNQSCHYAAGERRLLVAVARYLNSSIEDKQKLIAKDLLLKYIRVKNAFHQLLIHEHGSDGLMRFIESFSQRSFSFTSKKKRRKHLILQLESDRMKAALDMQLNHAFSFDNRFNSHHAVTRRIEMRVSITENNHCLKNIRAWMEGIKQHIHPYHHDCCLYSKDTKHNHLKDENCCFRLSQQQSLSIHNQYFFYPSQIGLVFHLIKKPNSSDKESSQKAFDTARKIQGILKCYPYLRNFIVGLDAAGDERSSPPRNFVKAYQTLQQFQQRSRPTLQHPPVCLGWTYHVGEDYADLLTSLRHLNEVSELMLNKEGGRFGHALALGVSPKHFYHHRNYLTELTIGTHLLDLVWARGQLINSTGEKNIAWLETKIFKHLNNDVESNKREYINLCYQLMDLDSDLIIKNKIILESELLAKLGFQGNQHEIVELEADKRWLTLVNRLQKQLRQKISCQKICIEANPTSNLIIANYSHYKDLPYKKLVEEKLALSLNTDDPGLFITSLPAEFSAMYQALSEDKTMSHREILNWLDDRVFDAKQSSFLGSHVPIGVDNPILKIEEMNRLFRFEE